MFEPIPELAPDLDWMLLSGQASHEMLAEALIQEFYSPIVQLANSLLDDPVMAQSVARDVFVTAILNVYRYRSSAGVRTWFFRLALDTLRKAFGQKAAHRNLKASVPGSSGPLEFGASIPADGVEASLWLAVDSLPVKLRLPLLFQTVLDLQPAEIGPILGVKEHEVQSRLAAGRRQTLETLQRDGLRRNGADLGYGWDDTLEAWLVGSLKGRWPAAPDREEQALADEVAALARQRGVRRLRFNYLREALMVGAAILLVVGMVWSVNILLPEEAEATPVPTRRGAQASGSAGSLRADRRREATPTPAIEPTPTPDVFYVIQDGDTLATIAEKLGVPADELREFNRLPEGETLQTGQRIVIPGRIHADSQLQPQEVTPPAELDLLPEDASSEEILERMSRTWTYWNSAWVDLRLDTPGPESYLGPPRSERVQVWAGHNRFLVLGGPAGAAPEEVLLGRDGLLYRAEPGQDQPWFIPAARSQRIDSPALQTLNHLFAQSLDRSQPVGKLNLEVIGTETLAGREALVVRWDHAAGFGQEARLWVDRRTGFALRRQDYGGEDGETLLSEVMVTGIDFEVVLPEELFDPQLPWRGGFAQDASGKPEPSGSLPTIGQGEPDLQLSAELPAPESFDPARSRLQFRFPAEFNGQDPVSNAQVLADGVVLGSVEFGNPWTMICDRSSDGRMIAYVSNPGRGRYGHLRWFNLSDLSMLESRILGHIHPTQLAFAPDGQRLALFGTEGEGEQPGVYIVDTETMEFELLLATDDANSLVWSPDGLQLALIGRELQPQFNEDVLVANVRTGEVVYRRSIDYDDGNRTDWPMVKWGVEFPVEMGGMDACAAPPE